MIARCSQPLPVKSSKPLRPLTVAGAQQKSTSRSLMCLAILHLIHVLAAAIPTASAL
jgi:hypothetical protein